MDFQHMIDTGRSVLVVYKAAPPRTGGLTSLTLEGCCECGLSLRPQRPQPWSVIRTCRDFVLACPRCAEGVAEVQEAERVLASLAD